MTTVSPFEVEPLNVERFASWTPRALNLSPLLTREEYRARVDQACEKLSALPDLKITPFILRESPQTVYAACHLTRRAAMERLEWSQMKAVVHQDRLAKE